MSKITLALFWLFLVAYFCALAIFAIGALGLFGQGQDPLAGIYLIPLGIPWNRFIDIAPEPTWPWLAAAAPLVNLAILLALHRYHAKRSG